MKKFKRGEFKPWSMVMVALIAVSTVAIVGMLSAPPSTDWAISKLTGQGYVVLAAGEYNNIITNQARMQLDNANVRGRAYPWDVNTVLTLTDGTVTNTFGTRILLIPKSTFSFGDTPNTIHIVPLVESVSDGGTYILELDKSSDGINFTPIGSVRFTGGTTFQTTFAIMQGC